MTDRIAVLPLIAEAWRGAAKALMPALPWLALLALAAGAYSLGLRSEFGLWLPLIGALATFAAGTELSRRVYAALGAGAKGSFLPLAHANLAVYVAFLFIGFFVGFFLLILPGILIEAAGQYTIDQDSPPALVQEAFLAMLGTPYGAAYLLVCALGTIFLLWAALRLTLFGAATAASGEAMVFRTWRWTRGSVLRLGAASLATHVSPFAFAVAANAGLHGVLPDSGPGHFIAGAAGILLLTPFFLAGHGLAAAALPRLKPADNMAVDEASASG